MMSCPRVWNEILDMAVRNERNQQLLVRLMQDVLAFFNRSSDAATSTRQLQAMPLIEVACLGNPERTMQSELHAYLRSRLWNSVCEMGYRHAPGDRGDADIALFDSFHRDKVLLCVIELKHFSANQGDACTLTAGLDSDYRLSRPSVPMMQIGLYTVVESITPPLQPEYDRGIYRFLNTYCRGTLPPRFTAGQILRDWSATTAQTWLQPFEPVIGQTPTASFWDDRNAFISGHVEYVVGIRQPALLGL